MLRSCALSPSAKQLARYTPVRGAAPRACDMDLQRYLDVAKEAAASAGEVIVDAWDRPRNVQHKGTADLVTETDKECELVIVKHIKDTFPDHSFIGEEDSAANGTAELAAAPTWIIDPVDGTTNFVHKIPFICVCIGLAIDKKDRPRPAYTVLVYWCRHADHSILLQVVVGVVYNPILKEMFTATHGGGATLNGKPIRVSGATEMQHALLATEIGTLRDSESVTAIFDRVCKSVEASRSIRSLGSCALDMVSTAMGRLDGFYEIGFGGPWDVAASSLIVTEAGGTVLDPTGAPFDVMARRVLCGTPAIAEQLADIIKDCKVSSKEPLAPSQA
eukprot:jgi/Ulvmu1/7322/UM035_0111.1